jgi:Ser-tRNA(Ala) deacylase AlaX
MTTRLLYLENMCQLTGEAHVIEIISEENSKKVILDQTVFYPQGGGQPSDKGLIKNVEAVFEIQHVSIDNGIVYHAGIFQYGDFAQGARVELHVDATLRMLHNKNHTAGHLIDYALANLGYKLVSGKAYHFPQGPYVEYQGTLEQAEREALQISLEKAVNDLVQQGLKVSIKFIDNDPKKRAMIVEGYEPIMCGGTHVLNTQDIGHITIRKIKNEKGNLRVSYAVI